MYNKFFQKRTFKLFIVTCLLLFIQMSCVRSDKNNTIDEGISGQWQIKYNYFDEDSFAGLTFDRNKEGSIIGKCGSRDLVDVQFVDGKLSFTRLISAIPGDLKQQFTGTLKDGKFTGTLSTDFGDFDAAITRKKLKNPALGKWDIKYAIDEQEIQNILTITENTDGTLSGEWDTENNEEQISNLQFQDEKLTFNLRSNVSIPESELAFEGTIKEHNLSGYFKNQRRNIKATAERTGAELVGTWEIAETPDESTGEMIIGEKNIVKITGDLKGSCEDPEGDEYQIKNLSIESDQIGFVIEFGNQDFMLRTSFKGKLINNTELEGELELDMINNNNILNVTQSNISGKKIDSSFPLVGQW